MGIIVPRFKHSAVDRNRLKRRLRELVRLHMLPGAPPLDIVIRTRPEAYGATFEQLSDELIRIARRLGSAP
jgi:ribonuclease P protein component